MQVIIDNIPYFTQTDNTLFASTSCYATSMAMAMSFCLSIKNLNKTTVGCPLHAQLEDYISSTIQSDETKLWIQRNWSRYGNWFLKYKPRTLAGVQEHIFNMLMKPYGFKTEFNANISFEDYCNHINEGYPIAIHGMFSSVSRVYGHIVLGIGYYKYEKDDNIIVHDPWGNALYDKYKSHEKGEAAEYPHNLLMRNWEERKIWGQMIQPV